MKKVLYLYNKVNNAHNLNKKTVPKDGLSILNHIR